MKYSFISIDYQNDFCSPGGKFYQERACHQFINNEFTPFLKESGIKISEIISDYRLPRPNEFEAYCIPGEWGYLSAIDETIKVGKPWIKSMNSPDWIRSDGGDPSNNPGIPYQDPAAFSQWLLNQIGSPEAAGEVILIGLTMDCCVLCTAQQLYFRNYKVRILREGTDVYSINSLNPFLKDATDYKEFLFNSTHGMWSRAITWDELKPLITKATIC